MEIAPWSVLNNSQTLEDSLPKNCDGALTYSRPAGICSGSLNSIFESQGGGSGKADGTLSLQMTEGATEPASASLTILTGIPGLLLVAWKRLKKRTGHLGCRRRL